MAAVPKKKISARKTRVRRHKNSNLQPLSIGVDKKTGSMHRSHHMCLEDGTYKGKKVLDFKKR